jgi:hypothetical protein
VIALVAFIAGLLILFMLLMPISTLLEFFLILVGMLLITGCGLVIAEEVSRIMDLGHRQKIQRELRELELRRVKRQQILPDIPYKRANRWRN